MINCNTCGEYAEYDCLQRKTAHAIIAATLACNVSKEDERDPRAVAETILDVLENAGLTIARASREWEDADRRPLQGPGHPSESMANCAARSNSHLIACKTAVFPPADQE